MYSVKSLYAVTSAPYHECTRSHLLRTMNVWSLARGFFGPIAYIHGTELVCLRKVTLRILCDRVQSRYGVDSIPQSHSKWFLCTLYTVHWHSFGGFYVSFVHSTEFSARFFLQSSELGPPSTAGECVPPPLVRGGEGVTLRS